MQQTLQSFIYTSLPSRVLFDVEMRAATLAELKTLGCRRALILSTEQQARAAHDLVGALDGLAADVFSGAVMHTPTDTTDSALARLNACSADVLIAFGGGSTIGLSKALALRTDLPQIAIPTTYAGSEMTPIIGETADGRKVTQRTPKVLPETVIYDVDLTLSLPPALTVTSGLNAMAHAVEALYARDRNPIISLVASDAISRLAKALPRIAASPMDRNARRDALLGSCISGMCLGTVGMALHHQLCHVLGGSFGLPHSETHAVILPHVVAYNRDAAPEAMAHLAKALGAQRPDHGLFELTESIHAPSSLAELGMPQNGLDDAADRIAAQPYPNPRAVDRDSIRKLLDDAYLGLRPD